MQISIWPSSERPWGEVRDDVVRADSLGWDGVWLADHFMPNAPVDDSAGRRGPYLEAWSCLGALAALTSNVRLGSLVSSVTYRHPAVLAAIACTVDEISTRPHGSGRVVLGIGAGWQENEHEAYGLTLGSLRERSDRLAEAATVLRSLLSDERTTFAGRFFQLDDAPNEPRPTGRPIPLLIAGKGELRTIPTAARLGDEWNAWASPETFAHKYRVLCDAAEAAGRDIRSMRCSTQAFVVFGDRPGVVESITSMGRPVVSGSDAQILDVLATYRSAGVDEFIVPDWLWDDATERAEHYHHFYEVTRPLHVEGGP